MIYLVVFFLELGFLFFLSRFLTKSLSRLIFSLTQSKTITINLLFFLFLPGIIIHELSHFLAALFLLVKTGEIEFFPKMMDDGVRLGSVGIAKTDPIRRAMIGFAPVIFGTSILIYSIIFLFSLDGFSLFWKLIIIFYLVFEIGNTMFSSRKDLEGTIELMVVITIIFIFLYFLGFRLPDSFVQLVFSERNIELIKKGNLLLLVPIGIDVLVIGGARVINSKFKITNFK